LTNARIIDARNIESSSFPFIEIVRHIESGGIIIYPTETVYGLGGMPDKSVTEKIISWKKSSPEKPMLLLVPTRESTEALTWTQEASVLADTFWPGPLTIILSDNDRHYPSSVRNSNGGVAVRISPHPVVEALVKRLGSPIVSTSANMTGNDPLLDVSEMSDTKRDGLVPHEDLLVLDVGPLHYSLPSTVVDCSKGSLEIIREGVISLHEIEQVILE